jgi:hypothetical protein
MMPTITAIKMARVRVEKEIVLLINPEYLDSKGKRGSFIPLMICGRIRMMNRMFKEI